MHIFDESKAVFDEKESMLLEKPEAKYATISEPGRVVMDNLLARATTKWTLEETKLFLLAVSRIQEIDENYEVKLNKKEVMIFLEMDPRKGTGLRQMVKRIAEKSWIEFNGPRSDMWDAGFIITGGRSDIKNLYLEFGRKYLPLVKDLAVHFTKFELTDVLGFTHKSALNLYMYLTSWFDERYPFQTQILPKKDIQGVFCLKEGQYWRNYGTDQARFDWAHFEKRVLKPAVDDINKSKSCDMYIESWEKAKDGKIVLGYTFRYQYNDKDGFIAWRGTDGQLSGGLNPKNTNKIPDTVILPEYNDKIPTEKATDEDVKKILELQKQTLKK